MCREFQSATRGVAESEARFYLDDADWNLTDALHQYREDVQWEKSQQGQSSKGKPQAMHTLSGNK